MLCGSQQLTSTTFNAVITAMKTSFSKYGIPELLITDNGRKYFAMTSKSLQRNMISNILLVVYIFRRATVKQKTIQTVKQLLSKSDDPFLTLLVYPSYAIVVVWIWPRSIIDGEKHMYKYTTNN